MEITLDDIGQHEFDIMEELFKTIEPAIKSGQLQQKDQHRAHPISVNPSTFKIKCKNCGNDDSCEECNETLKENLDSLKAKELVDFDFNTDRNRGGHPYSFTNCKLTPLGLKKIQEWRRKND
jgi:hypothetical protein